MNIPTAGAGPRGRARFGPVAAMAAALLVYGAPAPVFAQDAGKSVSGTRVLEASDHAELAAEVSASGVVRIALPGDRVARVIRAPGGLRVEHDPARGDLYLHPPADGPDPSGSVSGSGGGPSAAPEAAPRVLFIGTERGFTYRLSLMPALTGASQILIRNPAVMASAPASGSVAEEHDGRVGALVELIRAVVRRAPLAGHAINAGGPDAGARVSGLTVIETWRGTGAFPRPRFTALLLEVGPSTPWAAEGAADLAGTLVPETIGALPGAGPVAALWLAAPGTGPSGGRLAVAVRESAAGGGR